MSYTSKWSNTDAAKQILDIAELIKQQYPADWAIAHSGKPGEDVYIRRVAYACRGVVSPEGVVPIARAGTVGNNWKRGVVGTYSMDVLALPNNTGCADAARQFPGLELIDIIGGAGGANPVLQWADVTQATIDGGAPGGWVAAADPGGAPPVQVDCSTKFPPQDQVFDFGKALNDKYKGDRKAPLIGTDSEGIAMYVNLKGMSIWLGDYMRHRVAGMTHDQAQAATFATIDQVPL